MLFLSAATFELLGRWPAHGRLLVSGQRCLVHFAGRKLVDSMAGRCLRPMEKKLLATSGRQREPALWMYNPQAFLRYGRCERVGGELEYGDRLATPSEGHRIDSRKWSGSLKGKNDETGAIRGNLISSQGTIFLFDVGDSTCCAQWNSQYPNSQLLLERRAFSSPRVEIGHGRG